jgi:hypothetical protein
MLVVTYSTLVVDEVTPFCFQLSQNIITPFMETKKPLHDFLLDKSLAKSTLKYA